MIARRLAVVLCALACRALPLARHEWGQAMLADLDHVDDDHEALSFAGGCLFAAGIERYRDFDTRFATGLWAVALATGLCAIIHLVCAARGVAVLLGAPDGMLAVLRQSQGADAELVARYQAARPVVVGCFFLLGLVQAAAGFLLVQADFRRFVPVWYAGLGVAVAAVTIQLGIIWTLDGIPSEFYATLVQAAAIPALLAWSNGRHHRLETP